MFSTTEITSSQIISDNPIHQRLLSAYIEAAHYVQGSVLEIGCGIGRGLDLLIEKADKYTAIDKNKKLIEQLSIQYPQIHFITQHIPPLSLVPDESFDWVVSFQVIEHIVDDRLFAKEICRILKPGGKAIITTPNRKLSLTRNPWHVREYTAESLRKLLAVHFEKIEMLGIQGNEKVKEYYDQNRLSVKKFTRFDILNLQYILPRQLLQIPYEILNRMNRKNLQKQNTGLVNEISYEDYYVDNTPDECLDFFYIVEK